MKIMKIGSHGFLNVIIALVIMSCRKQSNLTIPMSGVAEWNAKRDGYNLEESSVGPEGRSRTVD